jgi:hypothetical protein
LEKKMPDFIPPGDDPRKTWATNFKEKLIANGPAVGLTLPEVTAAGLLCDPIIGRIDDKTAKKNAWQASVAAANSGNAADFTTLRTTIAQIKTNSGYTDAIGADLGIVGPVDTFDPNTYKAELKELVVSAPGQVTVNFGKAKGNLEAVHVYTRRQGTSPWTFLARDSQSPYVDTTPLAEAGKPEIREYRIRAVIADVEIGDYSDTQQITVS